MDGTVSIFDSLFFLHSALTYLDFGLFKKDPIVSFLLIFHSSLFLSHSGQMVLNTLIDIFICYVFVFMPDLNHFRCITINGSLFLGGGGFCCKPLNGHE